MDISLPLLTLQLFPLFGVLHGRTLICNYCYHANLREDCHLNVLHCDNDHVCSVETSLVTYRSPKGKYKQYNAYRMGCEHYSLCRDRIVSGPGPYGYHVTSKVCCCDHLCEEADGVGKPGLEQLNNCPFLWGNYTDMFSSSSAAGWRCRNNIWQSTIAAVVILYHWL